MCAGMAAGAWWRQRLEGHRCTDAAFMQAIHTYKHDVKAFNYGRPLNHLLTHVILVRVACSSNIQARYTGKQSVYTAQLSALPSIPSVTILHAYIHH